MNPASTEQEVFAAALACATLAEREACLARNLFLAPAGRRDPWSESESK